MVIKIEEGESLLRRRGETLHEEHKTKSLLVLLHNLSLVLKLI